MGYCSYYYSSPKREVGDLPPIVLGFVDRFGACIYLLFIVSIN